MPPAPDSKLPSELADTIIDYLHDDNHALTTCSTVCKAWLPRSRFHLLGHISLASWNSKGFFDLLNSPLSTVAPYVRYLEIEGWSSSSTKPDWLNDALPRLTVFTSIESLEVVHAKFNFLDTETTSKLFSSFQMLRTLCFWHISCPSIAQVVDAIGECPLLEHIAIGDVYDWDKGVASSEQYSDINISLPISSAQKIPRHLRTLDLGVCDKSTFLQWLLRGESFLVLSTVRLRSLCLVETKSIGAFLHALGLSLEHLEIDFAVSPGGDVEKAFCRDVNLARLTQLCSIRFSMYNPDRSSIYMGWVTILLSQITSIHIEEVVFHVWLSIVEDLDSLDWDSMAKVFARPSFSRLQRIHFRVWGVMNREQALDSIRKKLPACDARGILDALWPPDGLMGQF